VAGLVIVQLRAKQLEEMTGSGDGVVNGGDGGANGGGGCGKREIGNGVQWGSVEASEVKFALQVLLCDLHIAQGHVDVFVTEQSHESRQADAQAQHFASEGVTKAVRGDRAGAMGVSGSVREGAAEDEIPVPMLTVAR
jgi:hypothetical protein